MVIFSSFLLTFAFAHVYALSVQSSRTLIPDHLVPNSHPTTSSYIAFNIAALGRKHRFVRYSEPLESSDQNKTQVFTTKKKNTELTLPSSMSSKKLTPSSEFNQESSDTQIFNIQHSQESAEQQESINPSDDDASSAEFTEESAAESLTPSSNDGTRSSEISTSEYPWVKIASTCINLFINSTESYVAYFEPRFSLTNKPIERLKLNSPGVNSYSVSQSFQISSSKSDDNSNKWTAFLWNNTACLQTSTVLPNDWNFSVVYVQVIKVDDTLREPEYPPWRFQNCSSNWIHLEQRCNSQGREEMENETSTTTITNSNTEYKVTSHEKPTTPAPGVAITSTPDAMSVSKTSPTPAKTSPKTGIVSVATTIPITRGSPATMRETPSPFTPFNTPWLVPVVVAVAAVLVVVVVAVLAICCRKKGTRPMVEPEAGKTRSVSMSFLNGLPETDHVSINSLYGTLPETDHVSINSLYGTLPETGHVSINSLYGTLPETGHVSINSLYESMPETELTSNNSLNGSKFEADYVSTNSLCKDDVEKK